jgi:hypothetical protein
VSDLNVKMVIPFRDRGTDPRRAANIEVVLAWWWAHGFTPTVVDDGLPDTAQFNRHRAYNRAVTTNPEADVFVFTEADMLIHPAQVTHAAQMALSTPGLVVPFTQYRYLSDTMTEILRDNFFRAPRGELAELWQRQPDDPKSIFGLRPESIMDNGRSIGAVNVISRETLDITGGFTEATSGNWYDDNITEEGFAYLTGQRTRWVPGPAVHLYHLPGWKGDHLTDADKAATERNKALLGAMREDIYNDNRMCVRALMSTRDLTAIRPTMTGESK